MHFLVLIVLAAAAAFVLWTGSQLPEQVASHFGMSGRADAWVSRATFVGLMLAFSVLLPAVVWLVQVLAARHGKANIPHRDYWFDPLRRAATVRYLENFGAGLAIMLAIFMGFMQWLAVKANIEARGAVPQLDNQAFVLALILVFVCTGLALALLYRRFRRKN